MSDTQPNDPLEELFQQALEQPASSRDAWVAKCSDDPELVRRLRELLQSNESNADGLLEGVTADAFAEQVPTQIGAYRVSRLLGTGGMSAVFEAVHSGTSGRAAVKVIRVGLATTRQRVRFQVESELLAKLNHPGIAHLYDAGIADVHYADGSTARRMFIAMEYVDGRSISKYVEASDLTIRQRVELIAQVARAVQHAHESGVIHRDLKPANILVTADGTVKVVDFGIARLVGSERNVTMTGVIMGTPSYMSPEQMAGRHQAVSTRTDVYSLGSVLYELLAGKPPIETPSALTPSAAFSMLHAEPQRVGSLKPGVPRDLDAVVHKALERKPDRRYPTAREFAEDLNRWLNSLPVEARQPSVMDRARLQFRRRPKMAAGVLVGSISLLTLGSLAAWQAVRATRASRTAIEQRDEARKQSARADEQAKIAESVAEFMVIDILSQADSGVQIHSGLEPDPDIRISVAIDRAALSVAERFKDQPDVEAAVRYAMGMAYNGTGKLEKAAEQFKQAAEIQKRIDPGSREEIDSRQMYGMALSRCARFAEAEAQLKTAYDDAVRTLGDSDTLTIITLSNLIMTMQLRGENQEAVPLLRKNIERATATFGPTNIETMTMRSNLATALSGLGQYSDALKENKELVTLRREMLGANHPDTLISMNAVALDYISLYDFAQAAEILTDTLAISRKSLGDDHSITLQVLNNLAAAESRLGHVDRAIELNREAYEALNRLRGADHPDTIDCYNDLGEKLREAGKYAEALAIFQTTLPALERTFGADSPNALRTRQNLARTRAKLGQNDEALAELQSLLMKYREAFGEDHPNTCFAGGCVAEQLIAMKRYAEAEPVARDTLERSRRAFGPDHPATIAYASYLTLCLDALGRPDEAAAIRATTLPTTRASTVPTTGPNSSSRK